MFEPPALDEPVLRFSDGVDAVIGIVVILAVTGLLYALNDVGRVMFNATLLDTFPDFRISIGVAKVVANLLLKMVAMPLGVGLALGYSTVRLFGTTTAARSSYIHEVCAAAGSCCASS